jgi:predicted Zn-dependent protease
MLMTPREASELARATVAMTSADEAEVLVGADTNALTRFANNRINQNVAEDNVTVSVRAVLGKRVGVASTNRLDDASLQAACDAAVRAAGVAPEDPAFPGLPAPAPIASAERAIAATRDFDAEARAAAVGAIVAESASRGLTVAGKVRSAEHTVAVANSRGVDASASITGAQATVLSMGAETGSGWASFLDADASRMVPSALGAEAADLALRSANPSALDPGDYRVVLAPEAVADLMDFLAYVGFSAKAYEQGRSFMSGHLGERIVSERVTIVDDALADFAMGLTFDYEGQPKQRVEMIERGVAKMPVTDSYWADKTAMANTGHALPAPNSFGPMALNIAMDPGEATMDELIGSVTRGVYVTRFHYVNVEDPISVLLTGMTRDGTFLIENGKLTRPLRNLRFTQSAVEALAGCEGATSAREFVGTEEGASYVPGLLLSKFSITGQTA